MPMSPRGRDRVARVRAHRRRARADLLRLRRARDRSAARGRAGQGRDLRRLVAPPRQAHRRCSAIADEAPTARRARARGRVDPLDDAPWPELATAAAGRRSRPARGRLGGAVPARVHVRHDRPPKGALHVQGGFLVSIAREAAYQTDVKPGDRIHFATDMGWIMGPWTVVGGGALRRDGRLRRRRARLAARPAVAADRVRARDDARPLAHARARAHPARRARRRICRR